MNNDRKKGFTLIELLVVIAILGVLMGLVGPKVFDILSGSKATKTQSIFRSWVTQLIQYKEHYKYFPPFLLENDEGESALLSDDDSHDAFIAALKGMQWDVGSQSWAKLDDEMLSKIASPGSFILLQKMNLMMKDIWQMIGEEGIFISLSIKMETA